MSSGKCKPPVPPKPKSLRVQWNDAVEQPESVADSGGNHSADDGGNHRADDGGNHRADDVEDEVLRTASGTQRSDAELLGDCQTRRSPVPEQKVSESGPSDPTMTNETPNGPAPAENGVDERPVETGQRNVTDAEKGNTITEEWSLKESLESGDEACCTRLSLLIHRKAKELSSHLTRPPKPPPKPRGLAPSRHDGPRSFGDEMSVNSIRFADEDISEVSSDYQDLDLSRVAGETTAASIHHPARMRPATIPENEYEVIRPALDDAAPVVLLTTEARMEGDSGKCTESVPEETRQKTRSLEKPKRPPPPKISAPKEEEGKREGMVEGETNLVGRKTSPSTKPKPKRPPPPMISNTDVVTKTEVLLAAEPPVEVDAMAISTEEGNSKGQEMAAEAVADAVPVQLKQPSDDGKAEEQELVSLPLNLGRTDRPSVQTDQKMKKAADVPRKKRPPPPRPPPPKVKPKPVCSLPESTTAKTDEGCQTDDLVDYRMKGVVDHLDSLLRSREESVDARQEVASVEESLKSLAKDAAHQFLPAGEDFPKEKVATEDVGPPQPPPRLKRRARSRTVEVSRPKREEDPRRSHSLSEADVRKKAAFREGQEAGNIAATVTETYVMVLESPLMAEELRNLYVNATSEEIKSERKFKEPPRPERDRMRFRPLPAPPPPPRTKTKATAEAEKPSAETDVPTTSSAEHPAEKEIEAARRPSTSPEFLAELNEILSNKKQTRKQSLENEKSGAGIEAKRLLDRVVRFGKKSPSPSATDENANLPLVTKEKRLSNSTFYDPVRAEAELSAGTEGNDEKSRSSWYDDSDASGEVADVDSPALPSDSDRGRADSSPGSLRKTKPKKRPSSKFYCELEGRESSTDRDEGPPPRPSLSPRNRGSRTGEEAEDTDELLEMAEGLQKEMHQILVDRQKRLLQTLDSELSQQQEATETGPPVAAGNRGDARRDEVTPPRVGRKDMPGTLSSASEVSWQGSSEEESEAEEVTDMSPEEAARQRKKRKLFYIAKEMASSEKVFVDTLHLLNVDLREEVHRANVDRGYPVVPEEVLEQVLKHLPHLQALNERLLHDLCERVEHWPETERIADILVKIGPFLKLYSSYIKDFESVTLALEEAKRKYPEFAQVVRRFEQSPRCRSLTVEQYMLKPVQRIPQYRLLLRDYVDHLSPEAEDYRDACLALDIVSQVADHANESMKLGDNFSKMLSLQNKILGRYEAIKPGRIFIREGELMKASRKIMQPRWFVLFSDSLLYLTPVQQGFYRVNYELPLAGMKVMVPQQPDYQNEFSIISTKRSFILSASSPEEREQWIAALNKAIEDTIHRQCTFHILHKDGSESSSGGDLGKEAPVWIPDDRVTMCQLCISEFTFTHRRHHCRACGKVICSACSSNRLPLQYVGNKPVRVCDECYSSLRRLSGYHRDPGLSGENGSDHKPHIHSGGSKKKNSRGILQEVAANDQGSQLSGYLHHWWKGAWKRRWFVVKDHVLYVYRASEDVCALRTVPLLGFRVQTVNKGFDDIRQELLFELAHTGISSLVFYADSPSLAAQWKKVMEQATTLS